MTLKILVVEDDTHILDLLRKKLTEQRYLVEVANDGQKGLELALGSAYNLILLDVMLPEIDGITICQQLRSQGCLTPILLLTAEDSNTKKITGLDAGADDYIIKPFNLEELFARIRALLRRSSDITTPIIELGALRFDPIGCQITYQGKLLPLTVKEYALLELFLRNHQRIFSQNSLLDNLWSFDEAPTENTVRAHIKSLRAKLREAGAKGDLIETVYGFGYRLNIKELKKSATQQKTASKKTNQQQVSSFLKHSVPITNFTVRQKNTSQLAAIWERTKDKYAARIAVIEQAATSLLENTLTEDLQQQAQQQAHTLTGSLGSFGFDSATRLCREMENILKSEAKLGQLEAQNLQALILELRQVLEQELTETQQQPVIQRSHLDQQYRLLIVDDDTTLAQQVATEAKLWGIESVIADCISGAREEIVCARPDVVLLDLCFPESAENGFALLTELTALHPPVPVLVITSQESFAQRVKVARMGGKSFLQKPVFPSQIMEAIASVFQKYHAPEGKVLVVDDDPQILDIIRTLLEPWGFTLYLLDDPRQFWDTLEKSAPDMLILDAQMPNFSGIDLCQVVRNDPRWSNLPVLFISAQTDAQTLQQVFAAGADDYIHKPILEPELVARVLCRLERSQIHRKLAEIDPLTGISNRRKSVQDITRLLHLAQRQSKPFYFVILDLDHFKQINDRYGHDIGDRVLSELGKLLKQSFRNEDVVARWGGEEFVIGFYGITSKNALKRLNDLLATVQKLKFNTNNHQTFGITFSGGMAEYPKDGHSVEMLYHAADTALYQAKAAGRNQIFISS